MKTCKKCGEELIPPNYLWCPKCDCEPASETDVTDSPATRPVVACSELVGMRRGYDIICLAPEGFSSRKVANIRQAMCQVEMLLETGATKIGIYAQSAKAQPNDKLSHGGDNER